VPWVIPILLPISDIVSEEEWYSLHKLFKIISFYSGSKESNKLALFLNLDLLSIVIASIFPAVTVFETSYQAVFPTSTLVDSV